MPSNKLSGLIQNSAAFDEKARQVSPSSFVAFGIQVESRYGKCSELAELLAFAQAAALASVAHCVNEAFYDSKASICSFELEESVREGSEVEATLLGIAHRTVRHLAWFGDEHFDHGASAV